MTKPSDVDIARRRLLRKIGLGAGLAYVAPALSGLSVARASGGSGGGSGPSVPSRPSTNTRSGSDSGGTSRPPARRSLSSRSIRRIGLGVNPSGSGVQTWQMWSSGARRLDVPRT